MERSSGFKLILKLKGGPMDGEEWPVDDTGRREVVIMRATGVPREIEHLIYDYDVGTYDWDNWTMDAKFRESILWKGED